MHYTEATGLEFETSFWERAEAIARKYDLQLSQQNFPSEEVRWGTLPPSLKAMFFERGDGGPIVSYITSNGEWLVHGASVGFERGFDGFEKAMDSWALRRNKSKTMNKESKPVREDGVAEKDPYLRTAVESSIELSPLYEGQPIEVLNKISTKNCTHVSSYDYVLRIPYEFFNEFESSLYVIPFVYTDKVEFAFFVNKSDLEERPQFIYEAERWISGFLAGRDLHG